MTQRPARQSAPALQLSRALCGTPDVQSLRQESPSFQIVSRDPGCSSDAPYRRTMRLSGSVETVNCAVHCSDSRHFAADINGAERIHSYGFDNNEDGNRLAPAPA